jgi:hypothetical protein
LAILFEEKTLKNYNSGTFFLHVSYSGLHTFPSPSIIEIDMYPEHPLHRISEILEEKATFHFTKDTKQPVLGKKSLTNQKRPGGAAMQHQFLLDEHTKRPIMKPPTHQMSHSPNVPLIKCPTH